MIEINSTDHTAEDTAKLIANAVNFATLDIESLRYPSERKAEIEEHLYNEIIGVSETFNPKQQQNETRIMSAYEGKLDVVFDTKAVFEKVMSSVDTKAMKMKYPAFKKSVINLGDNFYLLNEIEYQEAIEFGNKNRIEGYIDNKRGLIEVKFKNNKNERDRKILIYKLEKAIVKFPYLNNEQIVTLYDSEKISDKDFFINQNFYSIIEEIEMLDEKNRFINEILDEMTYKDKLKFINDNINKKWQEREKTAISQ
ncbi:MAG: hypothetical protein GWN01_00120 [Nitrosopumilaceae archaeon]|nr:hypothetical protein [Nitrosopumilaceae archaeon]NIU85752.1 hypothetical protein [Nitrosopumilaceae archaeon]NIX59995.1 hypothetical protein [Nitrosopumilaceae archaeon]